MRSLAAMTTFPEAAVLLITIKTNKDWLLLYIDLRPDFRPNIKYLYHIGVSSFKSSYGMENV